MIRDPIPVVILFRALGCESDRSILKKILYNINDTEMSDAFWPSLEEAMTVISQEDALDYIAKRGSAS